jgi:hypothetical protein
LTLLAGDEHDLATSRSGWRDRRRGTLEKGAGYKVANGMAHEVAVAWRGWLPIASQWRSHV